MTNRCYFRPLSFKLICFGSNRKRIHETSLIPLPVTSQYLHKHAFPASQPKPFIQSGCSPPCVLTWEASHILTTTPADSSSPGLRPPPFPTCGKPAEQAAPHPECDYARLPQCFLSASLLSQLLNDKDLAAGLPGGSTTYHCTCETPDKSAQGRKDSSHPS